MTEHQIVLLVVSMAAAFVLGYLTRSLLLVLAFRATRRILKGVAIGVVLKILFDSRKWPWL